MSENQTPWTGGLLGLHALTALHPGSGAAIGTVDLPVQRERHTHWPNIAGSALKGILRDACREQIKNRWDDDPEEELKAGKGKRRREKADNHDDVTLLFGPPKERASEHAGAVSVTDARLLAYPVRSLKGVFAWITCPAVIDRLSRDVSLLQDQLDEKLPEIKLTTLREAKPFHAYVPLKCPCLIGSDKLMLEEYELTKIEGDPTPLGTWITNNLFPKGEHYQATRKRFLEQFVIVQDDDFTHFVRYATEVTARIGLNYETKTVRDGALFYQEFLPTETVFYSLVLLNSARAKNKVDDSKDLRTKLKTVLTNGPRVLQIGGDETTGKGYCSTRFSYKEAPR
jgi:CRISPR-associated protein Cmr4